MLTASFHTHSTFCDGTSTPREMVEQAQALGFTALGFSSHVDIDPVMDVEAYLAEIRCLQKEYVDRIEILCGGEFDTFYPEPLRSDFDYKIGSNHYLDVEEDKPLSIDYTEEVFRGLLHDYFGGDVYKLCKSYYERVAKVYDITKCNIIGHFDLVTKYNYHLNLINEDDNRYVIPAMEALDYLLSKGVAFEVNTRMIRTGRIYPAKRFLKRIREANGEIIISSDAHNASELNRGFSEAVDLVKCCGFDHTNYLSVKTGKLQLVPIGI